MDLNTVVYSHKGTASLYPEVGPLPNFCKSIVANPASATVVDAYDYLQTMVPGEAVFWGARRVVNLIGRPEHLLFNAASSPAAWSAVNGMVATPMADSARLGRDNEPTNWKLTRAATANSVLRTLYGLRNWGLPAGLDLLPSVPHVASVSARKALTNATSTMELRIYNSSSGPTLATQVITIDDEWGDYGILFTPPAPKRITALSWAANVLTVTTPAHGYSNGNSVRLSGSLPATFDIEGAATVVDANTFTMVLSSNPGTATAFGWTQQSFLFSIAPTSWVSTATGDIEVQYPYVSPMPGYPSGYVPEYVPRGRTPAGVYYYGTAVDGVACFDTAPTRTISTSSGRMQRVVGAPLATCRGVATYGQTTSLTPRKVSEYFTPWSKSDASMTVLDEADAAPTGTQIAARIAEGTHTGEHNLTLPSGYITAGNTADNITSTLGIFLGTPGGTVGRDWAVISFVDRAGTTQRAYANLATGVAGAKTAGIYNVYLEPLVSVGALTWWRVTMSHTTGAGASAPVVRIGLASGDNSPSYTGDGSRYISAWGLSYVGGTLQRPTPAPYGRHHQEVVPVLPGASLQIENVAGLVGRTNFAVTSEVTPYYRLGQDNNVDWGSFSYVQCASPLPISDSTPSFTGPSSMHRIGFVLRPGGSPHLRKGAIDFYTGDVNRFYLFKPNRIYTVGDTVLPTDTKPDNSNGRPMFTVIASTGPSGSEPSWPSVPSIPSATVTSGGTTFQCIHDNGINGRWEPYNGAHLPFVGTTFMSSVKEAWFLSEDGYGVALNGVTGTVQTEPYPVNPEARFTLVYPPRTLYWGQLGSQFAIDPNVRSPLAGADGATAMPRHSQFHQNMRIFSGKFVSSDIVALTE